MRVRAKESMWTILTVKKNVFCRETFDSFRFLKVPKPAMSVTAGISKRPRKLRN
jgi:hypothetical protein